MKNTEYEEIGIRFFRYPLYTYTSFYTVKRIERSQESSGNLNSLAIRGKNPPNPILQYQTTILASDTSREIPTSFSQFFLKMIKEVYAKIAISSHIS